MGKPVIPTWGQGPEPLVGHLPIHTDVPSEESPQPQLKDILIHVATYVLMGVGGFVTGAYFAPDKEKRFMFGSPGAVLGLAIANHSMSMYRELYMRERGNDVTTT